MIDDRRTATWVTTSSGRPATLAVRRCRLVVVSGPDQGTTAEVDSTTIRVGAHKGNDLVLSDRQVSGHHFEIALDADGFRLRDLASTNGTWILGHRVREMYLNPGTVIYAGESRLRFEPLDDAVEVALSPLDRFADLVGASTSMRALYALLERISPSDASVLITGETGTGKELVADAIHRHSRRKDGPFVVVDCGSIPDNLIGSELFGHEKGAFTGAMQSYAGAFERANGGTVFLDEIGELPIELQPNLLGVLERRQVRRIGGTKPIPLDIRVVSATNRDLACEMNRNQFRSDLFYRLAVVRLKVPALRERLDDVPLLVERFLSMIPGGERGLAPAAIDELAKHSFPGNVRELRNLVERAVILQSGISGLDEVIESYEPEPGRPAAARGEPVEGDGAAGATAAPSADRLEIEVDDGIAYRTAKKRLLIAFDARYLGKLLRRHGGNVSAAARAAKLDRMTVHKMMQRAGLASGRGRGPALDPAADVDDDDDA